MNDIIYIFIDRWKLIVWKTSIDVLFTTNWESMLRAAFFTIAVSSWILCSIYIVMQYAVYTPKTGFYLSSNRTKYDWTQDQCMFILLIENPTENSLVTNQMGNLKYKHIPFYYIHKIRPAFPQIEWNTNRSPWLWNKWNFVRFTIRRKIVHTIWIHSIGKETKIQFSECTQETETNYYAWTSGWKFVFLNKMRF